MNAVLTEQQQSELFDRGQFRAELTLSSTAIPAYKKCLKQAEITMNQWFDEGVPIQALVRGRAWLIDQVLSLAWEHLFGGRDDIALLAVGGYGRGELHPFSDIDILILLQQDDPEPFRENIEQFLTLLWDINLQVGSSVRSVEECARQASTDLTIITNLMESRTITGPEPLRNRMMSLISTDKMWPSQSYLQAKYEEQRTRHRKFNQTEYNLEPNIKSSPGGLRDLHMLGWITRRHYGTDQPEDLVKVGFLTDTEYDMLLRSRDFLWQVRWGLHRLSGRAEDRLLFDYQRGLAAHFGYHDTNGTLAIEQFMQKYFRAVMILGELKDLLLQHFDDEILSSDKEEEVIPLNEHFQVRNNYIEVTSDQVFSEHPSAMLELFVLMTRNPFILGPRASTIRLLRTHRNLIDESFRNNPEVNQLFIELMQAPYALTANLRRMIRYGILGSYLPEFRRIIGQMQHDLFHIYTVDAHTLLLIKHLRRFNYQESEEPFPVACEAKRRINRPELLYIAGLYHDIAKGRGGDHSELGAEDALAFGQRHGLSEADSALIAWLVRNHLVMSTTAQRKDLSDPETINHFAQLVGDRRHLDYLYCLTVADINATNPTLWNGWRASLLRQLYRETSRALLRGLENPIDKHELIAETQHIAREFLRENSVNDTAVQTLWDTLGDDYFLRHTPEEIAWHTSGILHHSDSDTPLVLIRETTERHFEGGTAVFIYAKDSSNLFAATAAALDQQNLSIHDARIITSTGGFSLDTFIVLESNGSPIGDNPGRIERLCNRLSKILSNPDSFQDIIHRRTPRQLKHFAKAPEVIISHDMLNNRTVVEVYATDRPGLLAMMGKTFSEFAIRIQNAKIATLGEKVEDVFFITDRSGNAISDQDLYSRLKQTLCMRLQDYANQDALGQ
ncbi:[protein-PII] uridylyltransferase [Kistimonas scapharcae]|uniref:Bifunctional uridylyltransferase/uridylyl-removing enzyme n=1 Tax=Kistimonas scapharcae TaxID=1036133 RepID=A0ABP8VC12_9GAMM